MDCEIETTAPSTATCSCCGNLSVRVTGFVTCEGDATAFYYGAYTNGHAEQSFDLVVCLGDVAGTVAEVEGERVSFSMKARLIDDGHGLGLIDGAASAWPGVEALGKQLSRQEALSHPWREKAFEIADQVIARDRALGGYLDRCRSGDTAVPLEAGFREPDDVFAVPKEERAVRVEAAKGLATLDGERFFVRCLLPIHVEKYENWHVGLWVEVSADAYGQTSDRWDLPSYVGHSFRGILANAFPLLGLTTGNAVEARAVSQTELPHIVGADDAQLSSLLKRELPVDEFERLAVAGHYL